MTALRWRVAGLMFVALFFLCHRAAAQAPRDPTVPPAEAGLAASAPGEKKLRIEPAAMTIIVRDGRPFLALGTRLYAQGEKVGEARIELISETEVWLREDGVLRKVLQFPGIQRSTVKSSPEPTTRKAPND